MKRILSLSIAALSLIGFLTAVPAAARPQPQDELRPRTLSLDEALARVEAEHPDLGRLRAALDANRGQRLLARGLGPSTAAYAREGIDGGAFVEQRVVFGQEIASPVATYYGLRRIDTEADALRLDADARRALLRLRVEEAFVEVMYAERLIELRAEALEQARRFVEAARLREEMGEAAGLETMRAEIGLAEAEAALADARQTREQARLAVIAAAAVDPEVEVVSPGPLAFRPVEVAREDVMGGLSALPELRSAETGVEAARLGVREAKGGLFPGLALEVFPQDFGDGFDSFGFQVGLRVRLPGTPAARGPRALALARLDEQRWATRATAAALTAEAEAAWAGYIAARDAALRYRDTIAPRADTLVDRSREGYLLGEVPLFALLDTQRTALAAEERHASALRDYLLRLTELERFTGRRLAFPDTDTFRHEDPTP